MKSKLLTLSAAVCMAFAVNVNAQTSTPATMTQILVDGFESWSGSPAKPAGWEAAPATTIAPDSVLKVVASGTLMPVYGTSACKLRNATTTYSTALIAINSPVSVTAGMAYQISFSARGKGTIRGGVTDGSGTYANFVAANGTSIKGGTWHRVIESVIAPVTAANAQFYLELKSTGTYTNSSGINITGIDVDSFVVQSYTPVSNVSLHDIEYTTATNGNSPFYGQIVKNTGGIVTGLGLSSTGAPNSYYIQTSRSNVWSGALVFDFTSAPNVAVGDSVKFDCEVDEFFGMTELNQLTNFTKVSSGNTVPTPVLLNTAAVNQEMYEGLLVRVESAAFGAATTYTTSFGQWPVDDGSGPVLVITKYDYPYTPVANTTYCIQGTVYYNFGFNIDPHQASDITANCFAGIDNYTNTLVANVYPNPVTNELTIKLPFVAEKANISVIDVLGKEVVSIQASGNEVHVKDMNIPTGVYVVKIMADGKTQMVKIIKQ